MNPTHEYCPYAGVTKRIEQDMYYGNGKPGITTRVNSLEECTSRIESSLKWIVRLLVGSFLSGTAAVIAALVAGRH